MNQLVENLFPTHQVLFSIAILLTCGLTFGAIFKRLKLPSVTGQIFGGILAGPAVFNLIDTDKMHYHFEPISIFALCLIAVTVGNHLNFMRLRNAFSRIFTILIIEALFLPLVVVLVLMAMKVNFQAAILLAVLAIATAPATIIHVIKESKASGVFVKTLVAVIALSDVLCIFFFEMVRTFSLEYINLQNNRSFMEIVKQPILEILGSAILGSLMGFILIYFTRHTFSRERMFTSALIGILLLAGTSEALHISPLLSALFMGVFLANASPFKNEIVDVFEDIEEAIFALFFSIAGTHLNFTTLQQAGLICMVYVIVRLASKIFIIRLASRFTPMTKNIRKWLGPALMPQAGVAIGLVILLGRYEEFKFIAPIVETVLLAAVCINEGLGPILTKIAIKKVGEADKNRKRLIEFIKEENITLNFSANSKEDAIRQLAQKLKSSHQFDNMSSEDLCNMFLERETTMSTCVGQGIMIPHIIIPEGITISGVIAISSEGLKFDTPDGKPVHLIILMATPKNTRELHLEVLAALARIFGSDHFIQDQIFHVKTPAEFIEILENNRYEDFNYFLED